MRSLDELIDDVAALLGAPCTLEDPDFRLIGFSDQGAVDEVRQRSILARVSSPEVREWFLGHGIRSASGPLRIPGDANRGILGRLCIPAMHLGRVQGYFWLLDPEEAIPEVAVSAALGLVEEAATLLSLAGRRQGHLDALFRDLVEGSHLTARRSASELSLAAGMRVNEPVTCVIIDRPGLVEQLPSRPIRSGVVWVREVSGLAAAVVRAGLLPPEPALGDVLATVGLRRRMPDLDAATVVGVGPVVHGLDELARAREGAFVAWRVASRPGPGSLATWADLGPLTLLGVARDADLSAALLTPDIEPFVREGPPDLVRTLRTFLEEAGSASRTADRLHVHRQTVYHRLAQIERMVGCDLSRGKDRLRLHLALVIAPYVG